MTALPLNVANSHREGVRTRTVTWTDPARARFQLRNLDGLARLQAMKSGAAAPPPAVALLGLQLDDVEKGRTVFSLVADEAHENPMGTMHGGVVATLVDTAMGCAVSSTLPAGDGFTTLELSTNYVRPITLATGRIRAEARVVHRGGHVATTEAHVYDEAGTLYAHVSSTCMIMRSKS